VDQPVRLWHVTVTVGGELMEPLVVRNALRRLSDQRPFLHSEIQYWEEAETLLDASSLALRVWNEYRSSAGLPRWEVVGLEVVERQVFQSRGMAYSVVVDLRDVTPLPF
jgi:hypothetical protein